MSEDTPSTALTEEESAAVDKSASPSIGKIVLGTVGVALLVGSGAGLGIGMATSAPQQEDYAGAATGPLAPSTQLATEVHDPDDVLSADDRQRLLSDAERLEAPAVVTELHYMVFAENHENVNDTVEEFIRDTRPELIGADDDSFADGALIVGVGLDPRQSFVFAGEDVADALHLRDGRHLDDAVTAIQPGVRDDNIPAGLFAGANSATDVEELSQTLYDDAVGSRTAGIIGGGVGAGALGASLAAAAGATARTRSRKIAQARAEERRAMAVALEQEMKAKAQEARARVIEAEAEVPLAMAEAFRNGNLGIMDYYKMKNIQADTEMRENIAKQ